MQIVTSPLLIYRITGSSALLGTMSLVSSVPMIIVSLFGGALADRIPKKRLIIAGLMSSTVLWVAIAVALETGYLSQERGGSWWILAVTSFLQGGIMGMMMPALQAMIPQIVSKEHLMNAIALNMLGGSALGLIAPGITGFLIDRLDFQIVYYVNIGLYVLMAPIILSIRYTDQIAVRVNGILEDIKKGFQYLRKDKTILNIMGFTTLATVLTMPYQQLLPIFTDDILQVGATGMGLMMSVCGAGGTAGSLVLAALPNNKRGIILLTSGVVSGAVLCLFAFSTSWPLSLSLMVFMGLSITFRNTIGSSLVQACTRAEYMGRVLAMFNTQWGVMSLFTFFAGVLAEVVAVQWVLGGMGMVLIILSSLSLLFLTGIRQLD